MSQSSNPTNKKHVKTDSIKRTPINLMNIQSDIFNLKIKNHEGTGIGIETIRAIKGELAKRKSSN